MSNKAKRVLLVFSNRIESTEAINNKVEEFRRAMYKYNELTNRKPEYYLLYVGSHIPSYALQSPEMIDYVMQENKREQAILERVGEMLSIPPEKQYAIEGHTDLQALRVSKLLKVDNVLGYSKTFIRFMNFFKVVSDYYKDHKNIFGFYHTKRHTASSTK